MNKLRRDIDKGEIVICEDGQAFEVIGGNGTSYTSLGSAIYGHPADPETKQRTSEVAMRIDADISKEKTNEYRDKI